jgi:ABC-type maltose transport system permease subunit
LDFRGAARLDLLRPTLFQVSPARYLLQIKSVAYVSGLAGGNMTEELHKSKTASEMTDKEKEEAAAVTGATALGCLGFVTLPFSIIAVMIMILVVVCVFMRVMHHI